MHVTKRLLGLAALLSITLIVGVQEQHAQADSGFRPGVVRAVIREEITLAELEPIDLPDGSRFTPYLKRITVDVSPSDLRDERDRVLKAAEAELVAEGFRPSDAVGKARLDSVRTSFDTAFSAAATGNCGFFVVQRLPDVAIGGASQSSICVESDPVNTHFWGYSGQVFDGLQAAGWSEDWCGPWIPRPTQYLWLQDAAGAYGFYANYSGWDKGDCAGTRNHVRLWEVATALGGGLHFSVGTAHRETWSWGALTHHVVPNGWHIGRDAIMADHPAAAGYYYWGNSGSWGSGGYFGGWIGELGCYSPYGC